MYWNPITRILWIFPVFLSALTDFNILVRFLCFRRSCRSEEHHRRFWCQQKVAIMSISDTAFINTKLWHLNVELNELTALPGFIGVEATLSHVKMHYNKISDVSLLGRLTALTYFYAYDNLFDDITSVPSDRLFYLYLGKNPGLKEFPEVMQDAIGIIDQYPVLSYLLLINLDLTSFPNVTSLGDTLTYLNLAWNRIVDIPEQNLNALGRLSTLNLYSNRIELLPSFSGVASRLQYLYLGKRLFPLFM